MRGIRQNLVSRKRPQRRRAFSLIELLCVIAIAGILSGLSWSVMGTYRDRNVTGGLSLVAGVFDLARQTAISKNSAVWVLFTEPESETEEIYMALVGSKTGLDPIAWSSSEVSLAGNADLELLDKVRVLPGLRITEAGKISISSLPGTGLPYSLGKVSLQIPMGGGGKTFTRAIQFTPTGEARVAAAGTGTIELGFHSKTENEMAANVAVLRVAGATGKTSLYRPN